MSAYLSPNRRRHLAYTGRKASLPVFVWLYLEELGTVEGPFTSVMQATSSTLWHWERVCMWAEQPTSGGCFYVHAMFLDGWKITSRGFRPAAPFRPAPIERYIASQELAAA